MKVKKYVSGRVDRDYIRGRKKVSLNGVKEERRGVKSKEMGEEGE